MTRRLLRSASLLVLALVATACQVHTTVTVDVAEDGSGAVEVAVALDEAAVAQLPDLDGDGTGGPGDLAALVRGDDLAAAGWEVGAPETADGLLTLQVTRPFGTPEEADAILGELTGPDGALRDLHVTRSESFGRTSYGFTGTADLSGGLEAFGDAGLAEALDGEPLGEDAAAIEARIGQPLADSITLAVTAALPEGGETWTPALGDGPLTMEAQSTAYDWPVLALAGVAVLSLVALVLVLAVRGLRSPRRA